jgi:transitional endoplasmic reticulum ATPase
VDGTFKNKQVINGKFEVQFFLDGTDSYETYRVKSTDNETYLLKLYNSSKLSRHSFTSDGLLEAEILRQIDHINIVSLIENGEVVNNSQKYHFLIFDFISGETLHEKIRREGVFSPYSAIPMTLSILNAVDELHNHSRTVIHNNINLNNVSLDYSRNSEKPILTGFNFARYIDSKSNSVDIEQLSPFSTAPELYNGIFTPQSDVFSIGALLYQMIFGIPPWYLELPEYQYSNDKFRTLLFDKRNEELDFTMADLGVLDDEHLKETIVKALSIDVENRFKSIRELDDALSRRVNLVGSSPEKTKQVSTKVEVKQGDGFSAIAGMEELKTLLYNDVIRALNEQELYESYGVSIPNGMLLYGPPGCGKTFISERFAEEVGFNFLELKPSDIKSKYINATEENIASIFRSAIDKAPSIIFIDEIDAVVPSREGSELHHMYTSAVNEILAQMSNCSEKGVFVIAASNRPEKIDPAMLRTGRLDKIVYLPPPDYEARKAMFELYLKDRPIDIGLDYAPFAKQTNNFVSSDIKFIVDEASRFALKKKERITKEIVMSTISNLQPSVSFNEIEKYELLREKFEDKNGGRKEDN